MRRALPEDCAESALVAVVGQKVQEWPATQGSPDPDVVAEELDEGDCSIVCRQDAVRVFVVLEHAERAAVGDLAD